MSSKSAGYPIFLGISIHEDPDYKNKLAELLK